MFPRHSWSISHRANSATRMTSDVKIANARSCPKSRGPQKQFPKLGLGVVMIVHQYRLCCCIKHTLKTTARSMIHDAPAPHRTLLTGTVSRTRPLERNCSSQENEACSGGRLGGATSRRRNRTSSSGGGVGDGRAKVPTRLGTVGWAVGAIEPHGSAAAEGEGALLRVEAVKLRCQRRLPLLHGFWTQPSKQVLKRIPISVGQPCFTSSSRPARPSTLPSSCFTTACQAENEAPLCWEHFVVPPEPTAASLRPAERGTQGLHRLLCMTCLLDPAGELVDLGIRECFLGLWRGCGRLGRLRAPGVFPVV